MLFCFWIKLLQGTQRKKEHSQNVENEENRAQPLKTF